jgi:uncharacterized protein
MLHEPPFPLCPCWVCFGNFDCFYYLCGSDIPQSVLHVFVTNPSTLFRSKGLATSLIRRYQTEVSAFTPARCHFRPTCSNFGLEAIERYGVVSGGWLIVKRLTRCRSDVAWGTADPVPRRSVPDLPAA